MRSLFEPLASLLVIILVTGTIAFFLGQSYQAGRDKLSEAYSSGLVGQDKADSLFGIIR